MPELPEVETVRATLDVQLGHVKVEGIQVFWRKIVEQELILFNRFIGQRIQTYERYGKYLLLKGETMTLISHLRMEGKFYIMDAAAPYDQHVHVVFQLDNGQYLQYHDTRKFGRMLVLPNHEVCEFFKQKNLGQDAIDDHIDALELYHKWHPKKIHLKKMLLDQHFLAGIGNIYADEICFSCGLTPQSCVYDLSKKDFENIVFHTRRILKGAIASGGTTIRSYTSSLGVNGLFQLKLKVHAQKHCQVCGTPIKKVVCDGRGTYVCTNCQKKKRRRG